MMTKVSFLLFTGDENVNTISTSPRGQAPKARVAPPPSRAYGGCACAWVRV